MEAITTGEGENNKVLEEVRSGYMLFDQVLRAAQVIVGKSTTS
jgi:molecular chaperone GrpE (heat shock protein)